MDQHQILTGAVNAGDNCYSVGSVEGVPFIAYSAGCNIVILASNFQRIQIIPGILYGNVQVGCIDCSNDVGKIAAAYGKKICIFEPTPLLNCNSSHKLDYKWIQTASIDTDCYLSVISWNLEGNKLLTGGSLIQLWHLVSLQDSSDFVPTTPPVIPPSSPIEPQQQENQQSNVQSDRPLELQINGRSLDEDNAVHWDPVWQCRPSSPICFLKFSPDGSLFVSAGKADRLVKIWYESAAKVTESFNLNNSHVNDQHDLHSNCNEHQQPHLNTPRLNQGVGSVSYTFVYIAHPRGVTGVSWRKTSKYIPRGSIANMLVTSCRDNICRLWVQTLLPDDGLVNFTQIESLSNHAVPRNQTQRHRQKLLQRLKHMKSFSQFKKRQATNHQNKTGVETNGSNDHLIEPIPTLPSTLSVHDFHSFGVCGTAITPGFHFHLAASINAETDIPLVPSMSTNDAVNSSGTRNYPNFVIHWLNNKEMVFTRAAEKLLQDISVKIMQYESATSLSGHSEGESDVGEQEPDHDNNVLDNLEADETITAETSKKLRHKLCRKVHHKHRHHKGKLNGEKSSTDIVGDLQNHSNSRFNATTFPSSSSIGTDVNNLIGSQTSASLSDMLDRRFESLLREWHTLSDLLFSIHPVDGSLLVWLVQWLDEAGPGSFRQAQVNFSSRIPNAIPLGDAATMSHNLSLYSPLTYLDLKSTLAQTPTSPSDTSNKARSYSEFSTINDKGVHHESISPAVCMVTKHNNGSLNLWNISFAEVTQFTQLMSISLANRVCGHRFRVNDISCHPVLPLLLTTSHHNLPVSSSSSPKSTISSSSSSPTGSISTSTCCPPLQGLPNSGFCSELILWKVDPVGPLSQSGGVTELARINSLETSAFANVAWLPTLLPSTTLGSISNSPSACFIASDGHQLRVYQAVIDARTLLSELSLSQRYSDSANMTGTSDDTSSDLGGIHVNLHQVFKIVSLQSTSRPGCILELDAISDATHDWQHTQLLHIFQEKLLRGDKLSYNEKQDQANSNLGLVEPTHGAVVDLRHNSVFREPFFLIVLEKDENNRSVLHLWKLIIASHLSDNPADQYSYVPDSNFVQEESDLDQSSPSGGSPLPQSAASQDKGKSAPFKGNQSASPLQIVTTKVCTQVLPLPEGVEILHATPSAGHLSSSNIYPACYAPYLICTACSDGYLRFWRCKVEENLQSSDSHNGDKKSQKESNNTKYTWVEWEMLINKTKSSAIEVPGMPLYVSCAYSGRLACAYKHGQSFSRPTSRDPSTRYININLAIYECESTGGSEWVLEDTIHLKNIVIPQIDSSKAIDLEPLINTTLRNRRTLDTLCHRLGVSEEHSETSRSANNIQRLLSVPSCATMQSLKKIISEQGNQLTLTQKSIVQLDWVSTEDGSHILSVSVGDKVSVFTPVSTDIAQANLQVMNTSSKTGTTPANRVLLKQMSSMAAPLNQIEDIRWMKLRTTNLKTADGLPPLPMQMSWVRDGILVVGMDNEMHIFTQWKNHINSQRSPSQILMRPTEVTETVTDSRVLTEEGLLIHAQESSYLRLPTLTQLPHSPSSTLLNDTKKLGSTQGLSPLSGTNTSTHPDASKLSNLSQLPDFGIFEGSRLACPVLPQYHPKQLMELLAFGKISRVRAILNHLVKSLCSMDTLKNYLSSHQTTNYGDETPGRSWKRSRALSVAAPPASPGVPSPLEPDNYFPTIPEEVQLDYTEITSIRPLPLFALIEAESEKAKRSSERSAQAAKNALFENDDFLNPSKSIDDTLDEMIGRTPFNYTSNKSKTNESTSLTEFTPHQARLLTKLLTHSHLPGLSSLDQMHLLALADAVSSFNPTRDSSSNMNSDYLKAEISEGSNISADSLDDCGLRYLLTMRQHTYLLCCLPFAHRKLLQKQGLSSSNIVWAFHSETQDELVQLLPSVAKSAPKWSELKELGAGWWIRNNFTLKRLIEQTAKATFQVNNDPLDAALFYLAMKKKSLVWGLYRSISDTKMTAFFQNDFTQDKWRRAALKNAYALLGKQRFEHAAAFFILAGSIWDAIEVCLSKLDDLQLAMVIVRLYEGDIENVPNNLKRILYQEILGCDQDGLNFNISKAHPDPFLRSMAYWMLQDYASALTTLLETEAGFSHPKYTSIENSDTRSGSDKSDAPTTPSVFNFYLYLRNQPLIIRRHLAQTLKEKGSGLKEKDDMIRQASEAITPFERRLYFLTAHQHFLAGCPSLALEVLSRLPNKISSEDATGFLRKSSLEHSISLHDEVISTAMLPSSPQPPHKTKDDTATALEKADDFDWGAPTTDFGSLATDYKIDITIDGGSEEDEEEEEDTGLQMKIKSPSKSPESDLTTSSKNESAKLDIMAQQLKFIACLKILMEELSTLATGFEVDGGRLRYHLYVWLEKSVLALKETCNYRTFSMRGFETTSHYPDESSPGKSMILDDTDLAQSDLVTPRGSHSDASGGFGEFKPTLHEVLLAENMDFEAKLQRAARRKEWLQGNEALLRTLLSYCSLHGAHGGGLASVRMELILLLQELQQERSQHQLLSPLPFPTTLPLLAASVACQKTVIADPIRHLHSLTNDILIETTSMKDPPLTLPISYCEVFVLRDLGLSLSACVYQSLSNSDNLEFKNVNTKGDILGASVVCANSHLLAGNQMKRTMKISGEMNEPLTITTPPSKWPGVQSLRALLARDKDEDSPKLHTLLCEAYVAIYMSQLTFAIAACDAHVLYRLVGLEFTESVWGNLFGGGAKKLIHVLAHKPVSPAQSLPSKDDGQSSSVFNTLSQQRMKLHMKILQQLNQDKPTPPPTHSIREDRTTYKEQFVPPQMAVVSYLMSKPRLNDEWVLLDYDSAESVHSDDEDDASFDNDDDDIFNTSAGKDAENENTKRQEIDQYSWGIIRFAVIRLARCHLAQFLSVAGVELRDLATTSPLIHSIFKVLEMWSCQMKAYMDRFTGPPPNFLPDSYVETTTHHGGPPIMKYKVLLEINNTPFRHSSAVNKATKRLWNYLVRQDRVQDLFIRYIFGKSRSGDANDHMMNSREDGNEPGSMESIKIVHKDQDNISAFCVNSTQIGLIALATPKEIQEMDISSLLEPPTWLDEEAEYDILNMARPLETLASSNYLMVQHPSDNRSFSPGARAMYSQSSASINQQTKATPLAKLHFPGCNNPDFCQFVIERSRHALKPLKRHRTEGTRRLCSHPTLPYYLSGSQDGSVNLWEWQHQNAIASPRPPGTFAKVTKSSFNQIGNKFGITDGDGNLSLWQVSLCTSGSKPFYSMQVHSKIASDFTFLGSSSLIITAGQSHDHRNVCMWDTLLPTRKSLVTSFACHEHHGASVVLYTPLNQLLITGGKKGEVYIFDMRQRQQRNKFQAHDSAIKCMTLDPGEEFFVTGSADGDIKVWSLLSSPVALYSFPGEHSRSTLFRNIGMGVSHLYVDNNGRLFSCGADGSLKLRQLPELRL